MKIQHFSIPFAQFDAGQLPPGSRQLGTPAFADAVVRYFARKYAASGQAAIVEIQGDQIDVTAYPATFKDPLQLALALLNQGELKEAVPILQSLSRSRPHDSEVLYNLGIAQSELGDYANSVIALKQLMTIDPSHANALVGLGVAYQRLSQPAEAKEYLQRAIEAEPENPYAHRNLAAVLASSGDETAALPHLRKAHQLQPADPAITLGLARCLETLGGEPNTTAAHALLKGLIERFPETTYAEMARKAMTDSAARTLRANSVGGIRPDVLAYIADAMEMFDRLGPAKRREIGFEVAMLGTHGLDINDPETKYRLKSLPGEFSGLHLSAIMYTAFRQVDPKLDTGLDYSKEYEMAAAMKLPGAVDDASPDSIQGPR